MNDLNVSTTGLRGRHHPALSYMITTCEVKLSRPHIKFLSGNYLTYKIKADQSPLCRICTSGSDESVTHVISTCQALSEQRHKILDEYRKLWESTKNKIDFDEIMKSDEELCQFILDPTSINLQIRVSLQDPLLTDLFKLARDFCFIIEKT